MPYTRTSEDITSCDDCGAYSSSEETIKHHPTCLPGESKKWEDFYNEQEQSDA